MKNAEEPLVQPLAQLLELLHWLPLLLWQYKTLHAATATLTRVFMNFLGPLCKFFALFIRKTVGGSKMFILLFLIVSSPSMAEWKIDTIKTSSPQCNSTRFLYTEKTARLELYKTASEWVGCFSFTSLPVAALPEDPTKSRIFLITDSTEEEILAYRTAGGQKLLLPEEALKKIFRAMKDHSTITLKAGRYTLSVPPLPQQLEKMFQNGKNIGSCIARRAQNCNSPGQRPQHYPFF